MYYFGYGSNMAKRVMDHVCPGYKLIGSARLAGYRLAFTRFSVGWNGGVADIVLQEGHHVWGRLYEVDNRCLHALDVKESLGVGYNRLAVQVITTDDKHYDAMTYSVINKNFDEFPAAPAYKATILEGATEAKFTATYMAMLRAIKVVKSR